MRLNTTVEEALGMGDCHVTSGTLPAVIHHHPATTGGESSAEPEVREGSLRINHAHEELMGMLDHSAA